MRIKVYYPSGTVFTVDGEWKGPGLVGTNNAILILPGEGTKIGNEVMSGKAAFLGDPRGVYRDQMTGKLLYNPRDYTVGMEKVWIDWLMEHPEWPKVLELIV